MSEWYEFPGPREVRHGRGKTMVFRRRVRTRTRFNRRDEHGNFWHTVDIEFMTTRGWPSDVRAAEEARQMAELCPPGLVILDDHGPVTDEQWDVLRAGGALLVGLDEVKAIPPAELFAVEGGYAVIPPSSLTDEAHAALAELVRAVEPDTVLVPPGEVCFMGARPFGKTNAAGLLGLMRAMDPDTVLGPPVRVRRVVIEPDLDAVIRGIEPTRVVRFEDGDE